MEFPVDSRISGFIVLVAYAAMARRRSTEVVDILTALVLMAISSGVVVNPSIQVFPAGSTGPCVINNVYPHPGPLNCWPDCYGFVGCL